MQKDALLAEVDDDLRRERIRRLIKNFGSYILAISILILLGTVGVVGWKEHQEKIAQGLTAQLIQAQQLIAAEKQTEAMPLLQQVIAANHPTISPLARIWVASLTKAQAPDKAKEVLAPLVGKPGDGDVYRQYASLLGADETTLIGLTDTDITGSFARSWREERGVALLKAGKKKEAAAEFRFLAEDSASMSTQRDRAQLLLSTTLASDNAFAPGAAPATPAQKK